MTLEEARQIRSRESGAFDADAAVKEAWNARVMPGMEKSSVPLAQAPRDNAPHAVHGEGIIAAIDRASRQGSMLVNVAGVGEVRLMLGPVIVSTALRDSQPIFAFNDMPDQLAYAAVSRTLNARALAQVRPAAEQLKPGMKVEFLGAGQRSEDGAWQVMPVRIMAGA
nr:DUF2291 family protein [Novosphingobium sediminicola]